MEFPLWYFYLWQNAIFYDGLTIWRLKVLTVQSGMGQKLVLLLGESISVLFFMMLSGTSRWDVTLKN